LAEQMKQKYGKWTGEQGVWAKEVDSDVDKHMSRTNVEPGSSYHPSTWVVNWVTRLYKPTVDRFPGMSNIDDN
jgi:hypothetical protein